MTTSKIQNADKLYVWIWLPNSNEPVLAGQLVKYQKHYRFSYQQQYRELTSAIAFSPFELPLAKGSFTPKGQNLIHSCFRDAAPDYWGRFVIDYHYPELRLNELDYLLLSDSNRSGALDFQLSNSNYINRTMPLPSFDAVLSAAALLEQNKPLPTDLDFVLMQGSSIGGAQPKATLNWNDQEWLVKFSSIDDHVERVKLEYISMRLADLAGLNVAKVKYQTIGNQQILLVQRFDRQATNTVISSISRNFILSGYSLLGFTENETQFASYQTLAEVVGREFFEPKLALAEVFSRLAFNILIGNSDDGLKNINAFWDGVLLTLSPAFGLCPQLQFEHNVNQTLSIKGRYGNESTLKNICSIAGLFKLSNIQARDIINNMIAVIEQNWSNLCADVGLSEHSSRQFWRKIILAPRCLETWQVTDSKNIAF